MRDPLYLLAIVLVLGSSGLALFVAPPWQLPDEDVRTWALNIICAGMTAGTLIVLFIPNHLDWAAVTAAICIATLMLAIWVADGEVDDEDDEGDTRTEPDRPEPPQPSGIDWEQFERWRLDWEREHSCQRDRDRPLTTA